MSCLVQSLVREGSCYVVTERQASLVSQEEENICTTHTYEETRNTLSLSTQERTQGGGGAYICNPGQRRAFREAERNLKCVSIN